MSPPTQLSSERLQRFLYVVFNCKFGDVQLLGNDAVRELTFPAESENFTHLWWQCVYFALNLLCQLPFADVLVRFISPLLVELFESIEVFVFDVFAK